MRFVDNYMKKCNKPKGETKLFFVSDVKCHRGLKFSPKQKCKYQTPILLKIFLKSQALLKEKCVQCIIAAHLAVKN